VHDLRKKVISLVDVGARREVAQKAQVCLGFCRSHVYDGCTTLQRRETTMKKTILLPIIFLAACGGERIVYVEATTTTPPAAEEPADTTVPPTTTAEAPTSETRPTLAPYEEPPMNGYQPDVYLDMVREDTPLWYYSYTDDVLINLAVGICDSLDQGFAIDRLLVEVMLMVSEVDPTLNESIGLWMRHVVRYVCPEHFGQIEALAG
jgi:hypothetical protein